MYSIYWHNTLLDNTTDIDIVMSMCKFMEYSASYSKNISRKISRGLWQYFGDGPALNNSDYIDDFADNNTTDYTNNTNNTKEKKVKQVTMVARILK